MKKNSEKPAKSENPTAQVKNGGAESDTEKTDSPVGSIAQKNNPRERARKSAESWRKAAINKAVAG